VNGVLREQLLDWEHAFDYGFVSVLSMGVVLILLAAPLTIHVLKRSGRVARETGNDALRRYRTWAALIVLLLLAALLGAAPTIVALGVVSLLCYREYARGTGLFREKLISSVVVVNVLAITWTVLDRWYAMFVALTPLSIGVLGTTTLFADRPKGFVQRVALGVLAVVLFGLCLGHVGYCANHAAYRPLVFWLLVSSLAQPLIAAVTRRLPGPVLLPNTTPDRNLVGDGLATLLTVGLAIFLGFFAFQGTPLQEPVPLILLGLIVGIAGRLSDLMLAAIRRDLGIPEPAVGRLVDRVGGLVLAAPPVFHYVNYHLHLVAGSPERILTGG
jgi:phosphatidate cytidylyltransferase